MIALLCNLSEQDLWLMTAADYSQLLDAFNVFMLPPAKTKAALRAIRFLGRRLHFPMAEYLDMPFSTFSDF
jgi:hypothetical protein